jgi:hypothetical protein
MRGWLIPAPHLKTNKKENLKEKENKMKIVKDIWKHGKLALAGLALAIGMIGFVLTGPEPAHAQPSGGGVGYYNPVLAVNSSTSLGTNSHFGPTTNGYWPSRVLGGDLVTNFTKVDVTAWKDVSIQVSGSADVSIGAVASQSVIFTIYRSLSGGSPTNAQGGGILWDTLGTITLPCTSSTSGPWTVVSNYCNAVSPIAGVTTLYIGKLDAGALTNGVSFTNYTVRVSGK